MPGHGSRPAGAAGARGRGGAGAAGARSGGDAVHGCGAFCRGTACDLWISRSGYTGEDGFEISVADAAGRGLCRGRCWHQPEVMPIGLGARDSLRLEAGLCLYGHDIDTTTSPVEAGLTWAIQKARRAGGARAGGFPGAERILRELADGPGPPPRRPAPRGPRADARGHTNCLPVAHAGRHDHLGRLWPLGRGADRHGLCRRRARRHRHRAGRRGARQDACPLPLPKCLSNPQPTNAEDRDEIHQGTRMAARRGRSGGRRHHRTRRHRSWAMWCSSNCPRSKPWSPRATKSW